MEVNIITDAWKRKILQSSKKIFLFEMVKPRISDWAESKLILPESTTKWPGPFRYRLTPYSIEIVNLAHSENPCRQAAVMKSSQCGITAGVVIPIICYTIDVDPDSILFTAADKIMAGRTIKERLDPIIWASKLDHRIRPNAIKASNRRTGDTEFSKEYAGGTLTAGATSNPDSFRFYSVKKVLADDFDTAPAEAGNEGDVTKLMQGRQKMYGDSAFTLYVSTPTATLTSQIYKQYQKGTMKKWHWACPECGEYFPVEFTVKMADESRAGLIYELDKDKKLIPESIHYRTQCCGNGKLYYKDKLKLNASGCWIATNPNPKKHFESYQLNDLIIPPGMDSWEMIIEEWLEACPPEKRVDTLKLKTFNNQRLGLPFEEQGESPRATALMANIGDYHHGIIPDKTCAADGNGKIILLTVACDLGGVMEQDNEDVRLDWELVAHAQTGATYSINHGSIGTFRRAFEKKKTDVEDPNRKKWTYTHGSVWINPETNLPENNCVWPVYEEIIKAAYLSEDDTEDTRLVSLSVVDTGFFEKSATQFIINMQDQGYRVYGVKGRTDVKYRPLQRDTKPVRRSTEQPKKLYNLEVNQLKDDLSENMGLQKGQDGAQPSGFMNFPQQSDGKYTYKGYFMQFEQEQKIIVKDGETTLGYVWKKKHSNAINHFWDVRVYILATVEIYLDLVRQSDTKYKNLTWEEFVIMVTE